MFEKIQNFTIVLISNCLFDWISLVISLNAKCVTQRVYHEEAVFIKKNINKKINNSYN